MGEDELRDHAKLASEIRRSFTDKADRLKRMKDNTDPHNGEEGKETKTELRRGYTIISKPKIPRELLKGHEH